MLCDQCGWDPCATELYCATLRKAEQERHGGNGHRNGGKFRRESSLEFTGTFIPPDYVLDGVLNRRFLYALTGRTNAGKTAIALLLAACVGLGKPFGERQTFAGRVFYFCGENPDDVKMRWIAMSQQLDFDLATIAVDFFPGRARISEWYEYISGEAQQTGGVSLVIVDTAPTYFEGDEPNNNAQQQEHACRLRTLTELCGGPAVVALCHPVKNAPADNLVPYGGGAFLNEIDGNLTVSKNETAIELNWQGKFRGPDFDALNFRLRSVSHERLIDSKGRPVPTVVAEHVSETGKSEMTKLARRRADDMLKQIEIDGQLSYAGLAQALGWLDERGNPQRSIVQRTLSRLRAEKLIQPHRDGFAVTVKGREQATVSS